MCTSRGCCNNGNGNSIPTSNRSSIRNYSNSLWLVVTMSKVIVKLIVIVVTLTIIA